MNNYQKLMSMSLREFADHLVMVETVNEGEEDYDGETIDYFVDYFVAPNGERYADYESAVDATVEWLNAECDGI